VEIIAQSLSLGLAKAQIELSMRFDPIANLGQGHVWDVQRFQGTSLPQFTPAASIYIGIYGAAAGIPEQMMQEIRNDYAFVSSKWSSGTVMNSTYTSLPNVNVDNVHIGYQLVLDGQVH
jgi:hypothetical protein